MKTYGDLDLKKVCEVANLDFAHFTYGKKQCSCCYGPEDMAKKYWANKEKYEKLKNGEKINYTFILFKNAKNGSGTVTKFDKIENQTYISHELKDEKQMDLVVDELQKQLGTSYKVIKPENFNYCIEIQTV